ncbi:MAG: hypothetical protein ACREL5_14640 [Gemmatimonadales bacterium]
MTLRVAAIEGDEDHDATWLLGHTERIDFGPTFERDGELWCGATIHVPCRYLQEHGATAQCGAHGYNGRPRRPRRTQQPRQLGRERFAVVEKGRLVVRRLDPPTPPRRSLPVTQSPNPCATARCSTSDHTRGSACCRDIQVDICCTKKQTRLEALIRARKAPYLCKTDREQDDQLVVEILSACSYLDPVGACTLHGRRRGDGRPAKPVLCSTWPEHRSGLHSGCAFRNTRLKV